MAFPAARPGTYNPDKFWDEENQAWYAAGTAIGSARLKQAGGRYGKQLITLSNQGKIYFGAL